MRTDKPATKRFFTLGLNWPMPAVLSILAMYVSWLITPRVEILLVVVVILICAWIAWVCIPRILRRLS